MFRSFTDAATTVSLETRILLTEGKKAERLYKFDGRRVHY